MPSAELKAAWQPVNVQLVPLARNPLPVLLAAEQPVRVQPPPAWIPMPELLVAKQLVREQPGPVTMPLFAFWVVEQFVTVQPAPAAMPLLRFWAAAQLVRRHPSPMPKRLPWLATAEQFEIVLKEPTKMPVLILPRARTPSTRQLVAESPRSMPWPPPLRTVPLTTTMLARPATVALSPSKLPTSGTPSRSKPLRSSVTPEAVISMPWLPTTSGRLPVR